jgi:hypothetical protein
LNSLPFIRPACWSAKTMPRTLLKSFADVSVEAHWLVMNLGAERCHFMELKRRHLRELKWRHFRELCSYWKSSHFVSVIPKMRIFTGTLVLFRPLSILNFK